MAFELIHTSSPRGIDPNARGFTTVAMSQGLGGVWRSRLESLSSYALEDGVAGQPVITRHVVLRVAGGSRHVLSRIAPCGLDYTGRPNRIAHHLVLEASECPGAGPAWMLQQTNLFHQQWDREPLVLNTPPTLADATVSPGPCHTWQRLTGDAGHAAHLLGHWRSGEKKQLLLVLPEGVDALALFAEAVALLDPSDRWGATFATLSQQLPGDASCGVQTAIAGTRTARTALAHPGMLTLDVSALPACGDDALTHAARTGSPLPPSRGAGGVSVPGRAVIDPRIVAAEAAAAQAQEAAAASMGQRGQPGAAWQPPARDQHGVPLAAGPLGLSPEEQQHGQYGGHQPPRAGGMSGGGGYASPQRINALPWIIGGVAALLLVLVVIFVAVIGSGTPAETPPAVAQNDTETDGGQPGDGGGGTDGQEDGDNGNNQGEVGDGDAGANEETAGGDVLDSDKRACVILQTCRMLNEDDCEAQGGLFLNLKRFTCSGDPLDAITLNVNPDKQTIVADSAGNERNKHYWFVDRMKPKGVSQLTGQFALSVIPNTPPSDTGTAIAAVDVRDNMVVAVGRITWNKSTGTNTNSPEGSQTTDKPEPSPTVDPPAPPQVATLPKGACCTIGYVFITTREECRKEERLYVGDDTTCLNDSPRINILRNPPIARDGGAVVVTAQFTKPKAAGDATLKYQWFLDGEKKGDPGSNTLTLQETDFNPNNTRMIQVAAMVGNKVVGFGEEKVQPTKPQHPNLDDVTSPASQSAPINRAKWQGREVGPLPFPAGQPLPKLRIVAFSATGEPLNIGAWAYKGDNVWSVSVRSAAADHAQATATLWWREQSPQNLTGWQLWADWPGTDVAFFVVHADEDTEHERVWTLLSDQLDKADRTRAEDWAGKFRKQKFDTATWSGEDSAWTVKPAAEAQLKDRGEFGQNGNAYLPISVDNDEWDTLNKNVWRNREDGLVTLNKGRSSWTVKNAPDSLERIWLIDSNGRLSYVLKIPNESNQADDDDNTPPASNFTP